MSNSNPYNTRASSASGFSLIEVMVVVVIIGIIASIALPSYREHVIKTRREAGKACLMRAVQTMERFYTTSLAYNAAGSPAVFPCEADTAPHYTIGISNVTAKGYTLSAAPQGTQGAQDTQCGTLSINATGTKSPATTGCW